LIVRSVSADVHEDSEIRRLLGNAAYGAVTESMPGLLVAAKGFGDRQWDASASPPGDSAERRFGPVRVIVPRHWRPEPPDPRRLAWTLPDGATITLQAMAGARTTPTLEAYVEQRGGVTHDGYYRFGAAPLVHASEMPAFEIGESAPQAHGRPVRFIRLLRSRRAILLFTVEAAGGIGDEVGAEFAAAFHSIRLG